MAEVSEREKTVTNAFKILRYTSHVDLPFFERCHARAQEEVDPPFEDKYLDQDEREFSWFLSKIGECNSVLEIGSHYGRSILRMAHAVQPRSRIVSIDMAYQPDATPRLPAAEPMLLENMERIRAMGHDTHIFIGDSHSQEAIDYARELGPYDLVFIDGDHTYAGVRADWLNYGPMAKKLVGFHDIVNNRDCFKFWNEVKRNNRTEENAASGWLGIGIVLKDQGA